MSNSGYDPWFVLGSVLLFLALLTKLIQFPGWSQFPQWAPRRPRRPLRPCTLDDCPVCRETRGSPASPKTVVPYAQHQSPRGRKKTIDTQGYACPHSDCDYFRNTDAAVHALIGYGHHGRHEPIQDFFCKACKRKFTARRHTALYRLQGIFPACRPSTPCDRRRPQLSRRRAGLLHFGSHSPELAQPRRPTFSEFTRALPARSSSNSRSAR
jgi:hypothetical protein